MSATHDKVLSHWAWGWADRFPDAAQRAALAPSVGAMLGFPAGDPVEPVPLDALEVPPSRLRIPDALAHCLSADAEARIRRTWGRSWPDLWRGFRGDFSAAPDLVARPTSAAEVAAVLDWASDASAAVVPFGGGTSVVGGVSLTGAARDPFCGVVSLDTGGLSGVHEVDPVSRLARIGAGTKGPALEKALSVQGLTLRHFPQSFEFSTLGGWLATRAGGHYATVYTHIEDLLAGLTMVTPSGLWESRRLPGSGAGPSPDRLAAGSEGTLGLITEAWMRVRPRPRWRGQATAAFPALAAAVSAARALAQSGLFPTNCRLLDGREAMLNGVSTDGRPLLIVGFESADHPVDAALDRALELVADHGGTLTAEPTRSDAADGTRDRAAGTWRAAFIDAPYLQSQLLSVGILADTFETACTWAAFDDLHADVVRSVRSAMKSVSGVGRLTMRFTHVYPDGPAPYFTYLCPLPPGDALAGWAEIKAAASEALLRHGATITHHHAVGRTHRPWYDRQRPEPFAAAFRAARRAVDPAGILNPGVLVDA